MPKPPLVLVDLDDTLFQTARKMPEASPRHTATLDSLGQASGYMSPVQKSLVDWLLDSADVVPVTARGVESYRRVQLPFCRGAICGHGAVILDAKGHLDQDWQAHMHATLAPFQDRLPRLLDTVLAMGPELELPLRGWIEAEAGLLHYAVIKHIDASDDVLVKLLAEVRSRNLLQGMHVHRNGNNLAFLPAGLDKRFAVEEWLKRDRAVHGERPVLGLGDSLTDLGFMGLCHLWATPARSQVSQALEALRHE